jgi:hypothetical protein
MIRQRLATIKTDSATLTYAEMGDVIVNAAGNTTQTVPAGFSGLWYHIHNSGAGTISISNGSVVMTTLEQYESAILLYNFSTSSWTYSKGGTGDMDKATYDNNSDGKVDEADTADAGKGTDFPTAGSGDDGKFLKYVHATTEYVLDTPDTSDFDDLSPMTTEGDIIYGGASGTGTRLGKGTAGHYLKQGASVPEWAAIPDPTKTQIESVLTGEISSHTHAANKPELTEETYLYVGYYEELTGTISATGTAVTGTSTLFTSELSVGDIIAFVDDGEGYYELREIDSITNNTGLVLTEALEYEYIDIAVLVSKAGSDDNDGSAADASHALATIQKAVDIVGEYVVNTDVYIEIAGGAYEEEVNIFFLEGYGSLSLYNPYYSYIDDTEYCSTTNIGLYKNQCSVIIQGMEITDEMSVTYSNAELGMLKIGTDGFRAYGNDCYVSMQDCNIDSGANIAIKASAGSTVFLESGLMDGTPALHADTGGTIIKGEPSIVGGVEIETGGRVCDLESGATASRPERLPVGYQYFDTTLGKPIWYLGWAQGSVTDWVDATGTEV